MAMSKDKIVELDRKIGALTAELTDLRRVSPGTPVPDYTFRTQLGEATLRDLFGDRDRPLAIHDMGQGHLHHLVCKQSFFVVSGAIKVVHQEHSR